MYAKAGGMPNVRTPEDVEFHASTMFSRREDPWKHLAIDEARGALKSVLNVVSASYNSTRLFACAIDKTWRGESFCVRVFAHVRPQVECERLRRDSFRISAPVHPAEPARIAEAAEPPLISAHDPAVQRRAIHRFNYRAARWTGRDR